MEVNYTLFIQLGIYLFLVVVLHQLFFKPILAVLQKRDALTVGRIDDSARLEVEVTEMNARLDRELTSVRETLDKQRQGETASVRARVEKKVNEAKARIEKTLQTRQQEIQKEFESAAARLSELSSPMSKEIAETVVNSKVVRL